MNVLVQAAWRLRRAMLRLFRVRTRGVKVMVFNGRGELLLIRNSYGATGQYVLPGGGIGWRETAEQAAVREVEEEVAIHCRNVAPIAEFTSRAEGKRDRIFLFEAHCDEAPGAPSIEIEEARFFALDDLPQATSAATLRRVEEFQGRRQRSATW